MTKSLTESELVAISVAMRQAMWTKNFVEAQDYIVPPIKLFEDNMLTIFAGQERKVKFQSNQTYSYQLFVCIG
jgi:hypothetical protein